MPARCVVAVELRPPARRLLVRAAEAFTAAAGAWGGEKWIAPANLHLTLEFIGALPDTAVPDAVRALESACSGVAPFELRLSAVRPKPGAGRAQMLWASFEGEPDSAARLAAAVDAALASTCGLAADERRFVPHVTLCRARTHRRAPAEATQAATAVLRAGKESDGIVSVRSVTLLSSTLGPAGPSYQAIGRAALGG